MEIWAVQDSSGVQTDVTTMNHSTRQCVYVMVYVLGFNNNNCLFLLFGYRFTEITFESNLSVFSKNIYTELPSGFKIYIFPSRIYRIPTQCHQWVAMKHSIKQEACGGSDERTWINSHRWLLCFYPEELPHLGLLIRRQQIWETPSLVMLP